MVTQKPERNIIWNVNTELAESRASVKISYNFITDFKTNLCSLGTTRRIKFSILGRNIELKMNLWRIFVNLWENSITLISCSADQIDILMRHKPMWGAEQTQIPAKNKRKILYSIHGFRVIHMQEMQLQSFVHTTVDTKLWLITIIWSAPFSLFSNSKDHLFEPTKK